jgi:hypothetical protein
MFNELAERNTREEENDQYSRSVFHVKRKVLTSFFGKKDTIHEINSGGKAETTAFVLPSQTRGW